MKMYLPETVPKLLFVQGFPVKAEADMGVPITGMSWKRLISFMKETKTLDHTKVGRTSLFKEAANPYKHFMKKPRGGLYVSEDFEKCERLLWEDVKDSKCNVVIPMDDATLYALTRETSITKWRGSSMLAHPETGLTVKVIPMLNPNTVVRDALNRYMIKRDLGYIEKQQHFSEVRHPRHDFIIAPKTEESVNWLTAIKEEEPEWLAFDLEILNQQISCISLSTDRTGRTAITIPFAGSKGDFYTLDGELEIWELLASILENPKIKKVAQNGIFDCTFLYETLGILVASGDGLAMYDTMIAHKMLYPDFKAGLGFLTSMYTEEPYYKDEGGEGIFSGTQNTQFWVYAAKDAAVTMQIWTDFLSLMRSSGNWQIYLAQLRTVQVYMSFIVGGVRLDLEKLKEVTERYEMESEELIEQLFLALNKERLRKGFEEREFPRTFINSSKQVRQHYYTDMGLKPYMKKKKISTDKDALKRIGRKRCPSAFILRDVRERTKLLSTYFRTSLDPDNRLRGNWSPHGAATGRPTSRKLWRGGYDSKEIVKGLNMLNMPPPMMACITGDKNHYIFKVDWSQIENRIVAYVSEDINMIRAFEDDIDVHSLTYAMMFKIALEEVSNDANSCSLGDGKRSQRAWGKQCNHSLNYGLAYKAFSVRSELPETEGRNLVERYHEVYPNVRNRFHEAIHTSLRESRTVTNCFGRVRRFLGVIGSDMFQDAYAQLPQSSVADKANGVLSYIYRELGGIDLLMMVYDSVIFQIPMSTPLEEVYDLLVKVKDKMEEPIPWSVPFSVPVDFEVGVDLSYDSESLDLNERWGTMEILERIKDDHEQSA